MNHRKNRTGQSEGYRRTIRMSEGQLRSIVRSMLTEVKYGDTEGGREDALKYAGTQNVGQVIGDTSRFPWLSFDGSGSKEKGMQVAARSQDYMEEPHEDRQITFENLMDLMHTVSAYGFVALQSFAKQVSSGRPLAPQDLSAVNDQLIKPIQATFRSPNFFLEKCEKSGAGQGDIKKDHLAVLAAESFVGAGFGKMFGTWYGNVNTKARSNPEELSAAIDQVNGLLKQLRNLSF
jgi:hypothetical protein